MKSLTTYYDACVIVLCLYFSFFMCCTDVFFITQWFDNMFGRPCKKCGNYCKIKNGDECENCVECAICYEALCKMVDSGITLECSHRFCSSCIFQWTRRHGALFPCPLCRREYRWSDSLLDTIQADIK